MSEVEYLAESLYEPNAYIVEGFNPGMIAASKPPVSLSDQEILSVIAYLQSLGGTPTVTMQTKLAYASEAAEEVPAQSQEATSSAPEPEAIAASGAGGQELLETYLCTTCHSVDAPTPLVGPSLYDVGNRLSVAELYESIMEPDKTITEGFPPAVMPATLDATGFYEKISAQDFKTLIDHLQSLKGDG